jgi:restriction system protein
LHYRTVKWLETDFPRTNLDQGILNSLGALTTIWQTTRNDAETRVRAMQTNGWKSVGIKAKPVAEDQGTTDEETGGEFDLEQIVRDQIARLIISKFSNHGMKDLVEAILQAHGFTTYHSDKGQGGGKGILAAPDTLGFGRPRICGGRRREGVGGCAKTGARAIAGVNTAYHSQCWAYAQTRRFP